MDSVSQIMYYFIILYYSFVLIFNLIIFYKGLAELLKTLVELANTGIFPKVPGVWEGYIIT